MNIQRQCAAIFAITLLALVTGARAEAIYRCGNSYSGTPCAHARQLNIDASPDPLLKNDAVAATRRDSQLASQLERERLQQDKAVISAVPKPVKSKKSSPTTTVPGSSETPATVVTPKRLKAALDKSKGFVAVIPGSDQKSHNSKKASPAHGAASR